MMKQVTIKHLGKSKLPLISIMLVLTLFVGFKSSAQTDWGIEAGINASTLSDIGNIYDNNELKAGVDVGIFASHNFSDWFAIKSGISYQAKGKKTKLSELDLELPGTDNMEADGTLHYAIIPLHAELSTEIKNKKQLFFASGPYFGVLLESNLEIEGEKIEIGEFIEDVDYGWSFEFGAEFPVLNNNAIRTSLSYNMGLKKVVKIENNNWQNKTASVKLGFLF